MSKREQLARRTFEKKKKTRADKTYEAYEKNLDVESDKIKRTGKLPFKNTKESLAQFIDDTYDASKRETAARMAKGGSVKKKKSSDKAIRGKGCEIR